MRTEMIQRASQGLRLLEEDRQKLSSRRHTKGSGWEKAVASVDLKTHKTGCVPCRIANDITATRSNNHAPAQQSCPSETQRPYPAVCFRERKRHALSMSNIIKHQEEQVTDATDATGNSHIKNKVTGKWVMSQFECGSSSAMCTAPIFQRP